MAIGDSPLDEYLRQLEASRGAPPPLAPAAPAAPIAPAALPSRALPWYNRPLPIPPWLSKIGRGARVLGRGAGPVGVGLLAAEAGKFGLETMANIVAGKPTVEGTVERGRAGFGAIEPAAVAPATVAPAAAVPATVAPARPALDAEQILGERYFQPPSGTGAIRFGRRPARVIDTRTSPETTPSYAGPRGVGGFVGDLLRLKQISGASALRTARARAASADLAARGTAARGAAALQTSELSAQLAAEYLRANPGDVAGAAAVLHGRSEGAGDNVFFPGIGPQDPTIVGSRRTGAVKKVIPTPPAPTEADIQATMKANKLSREQVIARLKQEGRM